MYKYHTVLPDGTVVLANTYAELCKKIREAQEAYTGYFK